MKFEDLKVGQRVLVNGNGYEKEMFYHPIIENRIGTIICLDSISPMVGVSFDHNDDEFHDCRGKCKNGYGWYVHPENITKILKNPSKNETEEYSNISKVTFDVSLEVLKKEFIKTLSEKHNITKELITLNVNL